MIEIIITISILAILRKVSMRMAMFIRNMSRFERMFTILMYYIKETDCPEALKVLYRRVQDFHNNSTEFEYQKKRSEQLLSIVKAKILMKEI